MKSYESTLRDRYTFSKPCIVGDGGEFPDAQTVWIKIGPQSFCIDGYQETTEQADWMRLMIAKAFRAMIEEEQAKAPGESQP